MKPMFCDIVGAAAQLERYVSRSYCDVRCKIDPLWPDILLILHTDDSEEEKGFVVEYREALRGRVPPKPQPTRRIPVKEPINFQSVRRQLDIGIRYLDLRVSYPPSDVRISRTNFRVVHALYGPSIQEVLQQVIEFLEENKKEVVILDMNHFFNMDKSTYRVLQNEVVAVLGKDQICPFMNVNLVSLDFMWKNGYRVVIFSSFPGGNPTLFWPAVMISSPWPNTNNVGVLLAFLDSSLEHRRYSPHGFFVTQDSSVAVYVAVVVLSTNEWKNARMAR
ncbi:unnamed protein product [Angiostrongylus costaricensis]|uniref:PLCXc domain-containing protein n=1 Tax=Angiostrongylus costaricensis TaxID=334426 RepID=A0A0R3PKZ5_ANGCS|nr:unnamed protein product [Angiostrongylus costaricensis]